jgi:hypothetical protein
LTQKVQKGQLGNEIDVTYCILTICDTLTL